MVKKRPILEVERLPGEEEGYRLTLNAPPSDATITEKKIWEHDSYRAVMEFEKTLDFSSK